MTILIDILSDGFFAAIAAIGFGAISLPPRRAFKFIALLAAFGHALRFSLIHYANMDIATSSLMASLLIGLGSLWLGARSYCPTTVLYIPALLPMIPGMYAYKAVFAFIEFMQNQSSPTLSAQYMQEFFANAMITCSVIVMLVIGAVIPIFIFSRKAYSLTRRRYKSVKL